MCPSISDQNLHLVNQTVHLPFRNLPPAFPCPLPQSSSNRQFLMERRREPPPDAVLPQALDTSHYGRPRITLDFIVSFSVITNPNTWIQPNSSASRQWIVGMDKAAFRAF